MDTDAFVEAVAAECWRSTGWDSLAMPAQEGIKGAIREHLEAACKVLGTSLDLLVETRALAAGQEPLGAEFEAVMEAHLDKLYIE